MMPITYALTRYSNWGLDANLWMKTTTWQVLQYSPGSRTASDLYRLAGAFLEQFVNSYEKPPKVIVLDMDHSEDRTHGQQELSFYNHHYRSYCYLPLFLFEGLSGKFITSALRPGKRPKGAENAMIIKRILKRLRNVWPQTHIILRGDGHFSNPELMQLTLDDPLTDFIFGMTGNSVLSKIARPHVDSTRLLHEERCLRATNSGLCSPSNTRTYHEVEYAAQRWPEAFRVILKAEVMSLGDNPRFVVTSLDLPSPECVYRDLYCARGQDENYIKHIKNDLASDRTSNHSFLANHLRQFLSCAAYVLYHTLRTQTLANTELAHAEPTTVMLSSYKISSAILIPKNS